MRGGIGLQSGGWLLRGERSNGGEGRRCNVYVDRWAVMRIVSACRSRVKEGVDRGPGCHTVSLSQLIQRGIIILAKVMAHAARKATSAPAYTLRLVMLYVAIGRLKG